MRVLNIIALYIVVANAWSQAPKSERKLSVAKNEHQTKIANTFATAFVVAGISILSAVPPVEASTMEIFAGSPQLLLAGRSGGRAGGRAGGGSYARSSRMAPSPVYRQSTTIIRPMIAPPPVVISPFGGGFGYGYNPLGGVGLGYSLGSMNSVGNEIRDYRQEAEIQKEKAELEIAKEKNAELEARIKALEQTGKPLPVQQ